MRMIFGIDTHNHTHNTHTHFYRYYDTLVEILLEIDTVNSQDHAHAD